MLEVGDFLKPKPNYSEIVATSKAGGVIQPATYYVLAYFLFVLFSGEDADGIFGEPGWVMLVKFTALFCIAFISYFETLALFKLLWAIYITQSGVHEGVVSGADFRKNSELVFSRPTCFLEKTKPRFNSSIDKPPMLLSHPDCYEGSFTLTVNDKEIIFNPESLQVIGFDRYRVSKLDLEHLDFLPHISIKLNGQTRIYAVGEIDESGNSMTGRKGWPLILIDAACLNRLIIQTTIIIGIIISGFSVLMLDFLT